MGDVIKLTGSRAAAAERGREEMPDYLVRHYMAINSPRGFEKGIVQMRSALLAYAIEYAERFQGSQVGDDGVLGECWLQMARGYLGLLNGETGGRLDCGTLDGEMRRWAQRFGFTEEL